MSQNGYTYAHNNPVLNFDPLGKWAAAAVYFIPGYGQIAMLVTGVMVVGYYGGKAAYKAGQELSKKLKSSKKKTRILSTPINSPGDFIRLKKGQGYKEKSTKNIWQKDMKHKDHWDISNSKGKKVKEVSFNGKQIWPNGKKNKNKK